MFQPILLTDAADAIRRGRLTPTELVDRCLEQIDRYEDAVHAWVLVDRSQARRTAVERTQEAQRGQIRGPLHGIPVGIKDIIDVAGLPTLAGSPTRVGHVAQADSPLVTALRQAGAIVLGKTVTVEFACFDPSPTRNPWNVEHTPGGSSSGSAAALATGMCLGALGTQTGGSLVRPSTYCGIATCKPTYGRLSTEGVVPVSHSFDHPGPMARSVADLAVMLACLMARPQPYSLERSEPPRLALLERLIRDDADPAIRAMTETAVAKLRDGGARVEAIDLPDQFRQVLAMHRLIMSVEAAAYHRLQFISHRTQYGPMISTLLDEGLKILGIDYAEALAWQREFRTLAASLLDGFDALVMPSTDTTAPATLTTTGTPKFQAPWSVSGLPLVSIPCGVADDGMPAAIQVIGRWDGEADLFPVAAWCERQIGFDAVPPMVRG